MQQICGLLCRASTACVCAGKDHSKVLDEHVSSFMDKAKQVSAQVGPVTPACSSTTAAGACSSILEARQLCQLRCLQSLLAASRCYVCHVLLCVQLRKDFEQELKKLQETEAQQRGKR